MSDYGKTILSEMLAQTWAMEPRALESFLGDMEALRDLALSAMVPTDPEPGAKRQLNIRDGVAHITMDGPLLKQVSPLLRAFGVRATATPDVSADIDAALADSAVKSIMLDIDSPGGMVSGISELADKVAAADAVKPVFAHASDMMASAALWVGTRARVVSANPSSMVGSIGAMTTVNDTSAAANRAGTKVHVVASSPLKGGGYPGTVVSDDHIKDTKRLVDDIAAMFVDSVAAGRGMDHDIAASLATGQVWLAAEARDKGLIDSISTPDGAHERARMAGAPPSRHGSMVVKVSTDIKAGQMLTITEDGHPPLAAVVTSVTTKIDPPCKECTFTAIENANPIPGTAVQTQTPQPGAMENDMAEQVVAGTGAPVANEELIKAQAEAKALKSQVDKMQADARQGLIDRYADRINPADIKAVKDYGEFCAADLPRFEDYLKARPQITRPDPKSVNVVSDVPGVIKPTEADKKLMAALQIDDPARQKYLEALAEQVEHVGPDKKLHLKDGRVMTLDTFGKMLGYVAALAIALFSFSANAGALSAARQTTCKGTGNPQSYLMTASNTIYAGGMVMIDSAGTAVAAGSAASNLGVVGIANETKTSAASGSYWISVQDKVVCKFAGDTLEQDDVGKLVYSDDDQTVDETTAANDAVAGILVQYVSASVGWVLLDKAISQGRMAVTSSPVTMSGDLTLGGGAAALTFTDTDSSVVVRANDTTALLIGPAAQPGLITIDSGTATETVVVNGTTGQRALDVAIGTSNFAENATFGAGAAVTGAISATTTITSSSTTSLGWHIVSGANTACETTCTTAAVMGWNTADTHYVPVNHDDATADVCLCAGAN